MRLDWLTLHQFRNYAELSCRFDPGVNLICGENAQGKTNLLEAIYYLSAGHGFRTRREAELIRFGQEFPSCRRRSPMASASKAAGYRYFPGKNKSKSI